MLELTKATCKWGGTVPSGRILVDGTGVGDVGSVVLRDRKHLAQDGMLVVVVNISSEDGSVITGPDIITRGFVYVKESENLMEELRVIAAHAIDRCSQNGRSDWSVLKANIKKRPVRVSVQDNKAQSDDPAGHYGDLRTSDSRFFSETQEKTEKKSNQALSK